MKHMAALVGSVYTISDGWIPASSRAVPPMSPGGRKKDIKLHPPSVASLHQNALTYNL